MIDIATFIIDYLMERLTYHFTMVRKQLPLEVTYSRPHITPDLLGPYNWFSDIEQWTNFTIISGFNERCEVIRIRTRHDNSLSKLVGTYKKGSLENFPPPYQVTLFFCFW